MSKFLLAVILTIGLVLPFTPSFATTAVQEMTGIQNEMKKIDGEIGTLKAKLPGLAALQRGRVQEVAQKKSKHDAIHKYYREELQKYNTRCLGRPLLGDHYRSCKAKQERLQQYKNAKQPELRRMITRVRELGRQYQETANEITLTKSGIQKKVNYKSRLEARLQSLRKRIIDACRNVPAGASDEEIKLKCGNVQFDGANSNLPSGDNLRPQRRGISITPR
ncbi:MAG: hypothetical protein BMS9Abin13_094 [Patescibacteria group bacterium]|nr:MAG: hypothetical protein BMS9Abin13_094 [Patescibacteria group bacterium]